MQTIDFDSHGTRCEGSWWPARGLPEGEEAPCVVMAHGFGATRDTGLAPFAERFAAVGLHVLAFDYRGFGTSEGRLRQDVDHRRHRQDYHAAIAFVRARADVDPDRVALWGSSYSGGHVIVVAAQDQRVAAVVSQGAAMDGLAARLEMRDTSGSGKALALTRDGLKDLARAATRRTPYLVPVHGPVGSTAVISSAGSDEGYSAITGPTFRNEMCARGILRIALNRPVRHAARVSCPTLLVAAEHDNVAPVGAVHEVGKRIGSKAELLSLDCGHFDIYLGDAFEASSRAQVAFLTRHLGVGPARP